MSAHRNWVRGWHPWDDYLLIHDHYMRSEPFVVEDRLRWYLIPNELGTPKVIALVGEIECQQDVVVLVHKAFEMRSGAGGQPEVRGVYYTYQALGPGGKTLVRYDNAHRHTPDEFHRHEYDPNTGEETGKSILAWQDIPTLAEFLKEVARLVGFTPK
ncbi:MAG: DUF6516 family protein [Chloroflexota bacterium]|nr:DUF6516 family protein [Chloroflexota bacterium]